MSHSLIERRQREISVTELVCVTEPEQQPMRCRSPVDDANNCIQRHRGIIRQKNNCEQDAQEPIARFAPKSRSRRWRMEQYSQ